MILGCPGALKFKQPRPESVICSDCGEEVEIWSDEFKATCSNCEKVIERMKSLSCLDWCKCAKECVGVAIYTKYFQNKANKNK